jgi:hypothetical protein
MLISSVLHRTPATTLFAQIRTRRSAHSLVVWSVVYTTFRIWIDALSVARGRE